jgi:hypothetical protein
VGGLLIISDSCSDADPVNILPKNTVITRNKKYLPPALLSNEDKEVNPSILDINMRIHGRIKRKIFNANPGK